MKEFLNARHILYLSSGRAALWLILRALSQLKPHRREVIIPAYTCPAVASAVLKAGLHPSLVDINLADFGFSKEDLQRKITSNTLAVIVVHLFGYPANLDEVFECRKSHDIFLIEDAAQAFGNTLLNSPEKKLGLMGDAGFFSFGRGKPISILHGGILATNSEKIFLEAWKIYENLGHRIRYENLKYVLKLVSYLFFSSSYMYWIPQKVPFLHLGETIFEPDFNMSQGIDLAGYLMEELVESIEAEKEIRKENSRRYGTILGENTWVQRLPHSEFPFLRYPFLVKDRKVRDRILEQLMSHGTGAALFYPTPLNELPGLKEILRDNTVYPTAKKLSESLITLPVHSDVTPSHRERIVTLIRKELQW